MTVGLGLYEQNGTTTSGGQPVLDENGNQVFDDQGNPVYEPTIEIPYLVLGLAPALGLSTEHRFLPRLKGVGALRASYSRAIVIYGDATGAGGFFLEPELGLVAEPMTGLSVGLGLSLGWPMLPALATSGDGFPPLVTTLSVSYALPLKHKAANPSQP